VSVVLIVVQNLVGIGTTRLLDLHPIVGLLGGSITLVGGHGTGAAYAARLGEAMNLHGIMELTMACATAGLVLGAVLDGPVAEYLLKRYRLTASASAMSEPAHASAGDAPDDVVTAQSLINTLFVVLLCLAVGKILAGAMAGTGLILPDFVFCLLLGVVIRNAASLTRAFRVSETTVDVVGNVALSLFLVMALMILLVMTVLGCSRGPDATALRAEVQGKLDQRFKPGLSPATLAQGPGRDGEGDRRCEERREPARRHHQGVREHDLRVGPRSMAER
jgi:sodium--glutamate symport carrier gltS